MEKEKITNVSQGMKNIEKKKIQHLMTGIFAVVKDENGEEKEVNMRNIVGSKGKKE